MDYQVGINCFPNVVMQPKSTIVPLFVIPYSGIGKVLVGVSLRRFDPV
jgi:hypothetical protein